MAKVPDFTDAKELKVYLREQRRKKKPHTQQEISDAKLKLKAKKEKK